MNLYLSLDAARNYIKHDVTQTGDDELILNLLYHASRSIDQFTRRKFYPRLETRYYDYRDSQLLRVDDDLLEVASLTTQNGSCAISPNAFWLATGENWNLTPYDRVVLRSDSGSQLYYSGTPQRSNHLQGFWGFREDYGEAWVDTGASLAAQYTASATTLGVGATGASDVWGQAPRYSLGDTLRISDQLFYVLGTSGSTVTVKPYINGTGPTAQTNSGTIGSGASIARWSPQPDIVWVTKRLTAWIYGQKDSPFTQKQAFFNVGVLEIPEQWPVDVKERLSRFVRRDFQIYPSNY